jgi:hypothetical protein
MERFKYNSLLLGSMENQKSSLVQIIKQITVGTALAISAGIGLNTDITQGLCPKSQF